MAEKDTLHQVYERDTCQLCNKPVTRELMEERYKKKFWAVCDECVPKVEKMYIELQESMSKWKALKK